MCGVEDKYEDKVRGYHFTQKSTRERSKKLNQVSKFSQ